MELNKDASLLKAIREEVRGVFITDSNTGERKLDIQKALGMPLLQSMFTEILRLRVSMVIMRVVEKPMVIEGVNIAEGSMIHAYSQLAQTNEDIWGAPDHPASEFWAERHIKYIEERDETGQLHEKRVFAMAASPGYFFPFGKHINFITKFNL